MEELKKENSELKNKIIILEEQMKKYSNPSRNKKFYQNHKEEMIKSTTEYKKNLPKEKIQEYNQRSYQRRKDKKLLEKNESNTI
jgi:hypothetical protein